VRTVALDVHKHFSEIAVHENGGLRRLGRIETSQLRAFAESLGPDDHVVLESTSMTWAIAELLAKHAGRVTVSNPMRTRAIASAKVKTDKIDAKVLAQLGAADFLPEVWAPDEQTRALRRRVSHRSSLVRQRTRLRNQIHAVLARNLIEAPFTDVFGLGGREWLNGSFRSWNAESPVLAGDSGYAGGVGLATIRAWWPAARGLWSGSGSGRWSAGRCGCWWRCGRRCV
jgi:transposase